MLSFFTTPKPFSGHIGIIQTNALRSWKAIDRASEILLFGDETGVGEIADRLDARHCPEVECSERGTPLISDMFRRAARLASHALLVYANADILFLDGLAEAGRAVAREHDRFLLSGERTDLRVEEALDVGEASDRDALHRKVRREGTRHGPTGLDYFIFPRGEFVDLPPMSVGRAGWDNYLVYRARREGIPVVDVTRTVSAVHQDHGYDHHPAGKEGVHDGREARANRELAGGLGRLLDLRDVSHRLEGQEVVPVRPWDRPLRGTLVHLLMEHDVAWPLRWLRTARRRISGAEG